MRKQQQKKLESKAGKSFDVPVQLAKVLERLKRIEEEVFGMSLADEPDPPVKKGRKSGLATEELLHRRKNMIPWLEYEWPELSLELRLAKTKEDAVSAIKTAVGEGGYPFQGAFYRTPDRFADQLWQFIRSGRYRENPRNLAAAMSGLPEIGWKRSFDICSAHPLGSGGMQVRAYRDYLRRKFPERFSALLKAKTTEEIVEILKSSRSKDSILQHLLKHPARVRNWLEAGKPGNKNLTIDVG